MNKNKIVRIYFPNGNIEIYTTSKVVNEGDASHVLVNTLECELGIVNIAYFEDGKVIGKSFCMPYELELF